MSIQLSDHFTYKKSLRFTLPSITTIIFTSIYGVVDGFFVSNFVGKTPFAAINFILPFITILGAVNIMFGTAEALSYDDFPIATARMYHLDNKSVMIGRVVVLLEYKQQGIGTRVIQECEQWVLDLGYQKAVLESRDNKVPFYRQMGYEECGEPFIEGETFRCVRMEKEIN